MQITTRQDVQKLRACRGYDWCSGAGQTRAAKRRDALLGPLSLAQNRS